MPQKKAISTTLAEYSVHFSKNTCTYAVFLKSNFVLLTLHLNYIEQSSTKRKLHLYAFIEILIIIGHQNLIILIANIF